MNIPRKSHSLLFAAALAALWVENSGANSAIWKLNPDNGDWNSLTNWSAGGPPNGPNDTATFDFTMMSALFLSANTEVDAMMFTSGASIPYAIKINTGTRLTVSGTGIINNSAVTQNFIVDGGSKNFAVMSFENSATAGNSTNFTVRGATDFGTRGGLLEFHQNSTAETGTFTNEGAFFATLGGGTTAFYENSSAGSGYFTNNGGISFDAAAGQVEFRENSSAGNGTFTNNGGTAGFGGTTIVTDNATADHGTFINNAGGSTLLSSTAADGTFINNGASVMDANGGATIFYSSTAGNAVLIANGGSGGGLGGQISFVNSSDGGTARVEVFGNAFLYIQDHFGPGVTIGSLEGTGNVFVGARNLTIGSNNLSTIFSGVIEEGSPGSDYTGGSLTKIGSGTLILSGANTYTGQTTVSAGKLLVNGSIVSAVTVSGGTLGGSGTTGAITVNKSGTLSPGNSPGILNVNGNLKLSLGSTYLVDLNGTAVGKEYDQTNVSGTVDLGAATLSLNLGFIPIAGTTFEIINNDLSDPVTGIFDGLPDGGIFTAGGQFFTISYHGGDGNDVVLNAVPEPQTWILVIVGLSALGIARKRISIRNSG